MTVYIFTIIMVTLFTLGLLTLIRGSFDRQIKVTLSAIKVTRFDGDQSYLICRDDFDRSLIQNIFKKIDHHLWKNVSIELKANYCIVLHSVAGACVM